MIISNNSPSVKAKLAFSAEKRIKSRLCSSFRPARSLQTAKKPLYCSYYSDDRDRPCFSIVRRSEPRMVQGGGGWKRNGITRERARQRQKPSNARRIPRVKGFLSGRILSPSRVVPRKAGISCFSSLFFRGGRLFFYAFFRANQLADFT